MPKQNLKLKKTFYRTAYPCLRAKGEGGASWWTMSARWICSWTMLETKNLNNAWDQDQKFELWMRPRPKIWIISETNTKIWTMLETETENLSNPKKNDPKVTWGNTCGRGRSVLFKRSFQAAEEEEDSKDEDDDDNPRRRAVRRFDSDSLSQSIAASIWLLKPEPMHMFETEYLEFQPNIKKCPTLKESLQKIEFSSKKHRPFFKTLFYDLNRKFPKLKLCEQARPPLLTTNRHTRQPARLPQVRETFPQVSANVERSRQGRWPGMWSGRSLVSA